MGTIDRISGYRFHVFLISKDKNRSEHGFHLHVMKGKRTYFRVDLDTLEKLDPIPTDMKQGEISAINYQIKKFREQLKQKATDIRKK